MSLTDSYTGLSTQQYLIIRWFEGNECTNDDCTKMINAYGGWRAHRFGAKAGTLGFFFKAGMPNLITSFIQGILKNVNGRHVSGCALHWVPDRYDHEVDSSRSMDSSIDFSKRWDGFFIDFNAKDYHHVRSCLTPTEALHLITSLNKGIDIGMGSITSSRERNDFKTIVREFFSV
ncbi:MAG: hypothetical protein Gaeavirus1_25 [Gaeavirus sp.]|uniref:Uncharacterized protein n=1 Tax=Gaeavirus sp. TaxID=2487767 RepID=A0A3G4ZY99_9VIRU|nr:MAG: hypothetical protein Gaeavirus1_25 [Gaeavirus sp.]